MTRKSFPLVSVGIPTYNRPEKLKEILSSIISQTYQNLEIIVSDNCSSNAETERVVSDLMKIDPRIRYFYQKENLGLFYNFKFVFDVSKGDYFTWAADDDIRSESYIEDCIDVFQTVRQSTNLVLVNSYSQLLDLESNKILKTDYGCTTVGLKPSERYCKYLSSIYTEQAGIGDLIYGVIKRQALQQAMEIQPNVLDWDHILLGTLALKGEFYSIPKPLMGSRSGGMSTLKDVKKMAKIQLITNPLYAKKAQWVRAFFLQKRTWFSKNLSVLDKISLSTQIMWSTFIRSLKIKFQNQLSNKMN